MKYVDTASNIGDAVQVDIRAKHLFAISPLR